MEAIEENSQTLPPSFVIIDDDFEFGQQLAKAFMGRGFQATHFTSSKQAFNNLSDGPYRIILDLRLRGEHGIDVLREIRSRFPRAQTLLLTGYGTIDSAVEAMKLGAIHFLTKPVSPTEIIENFENNTPSTHSNAQTLEEVEWEHINRVLTETGGNISKSARLLGLHRRSLQRKLATRSLSDTET